MSGFSVIVGVEKHWYIFQKENVKIEWEILKKCKKYKSGSKRCDVCLSENLEILKGKRAGERMLNKRSELMKVYFRTGMNVSVT